MTDLFEIKKFDHLEFTVADATTTAKIFKRGLGMAYIGESRHETGNHMYCSYVLRTNDIKYIFTAPYLTQMQTAETKTPYPKYDPERAKKFILRHGNGVSAVGVEVADAAEAYRIATANGAPGILPPTVLEENGGRVVISEIEFYGDRTSSDPLHQTETVLRFISYEGYNGPFIPGYQAVQDPTPLDYGVEKMDHCVGNVWTMETCIANLKKWIGFHTFSKFTKEQIQTPWTALNSEVLSSNNQRVLLPINEHAESKKESQILEYLKAYNGPGVQHLALKTPNILKAVKLMKDNSDVGFSFMNTPRSYYEDEKVARAMKKHLTEAEADAVMELGILVDLDGEGLLLQIFTLPLFDRPTIFIEIIQRKCMGETLDIPGCGGFGNGNFKALFEAIERLQAMRSDDEKWKAEIQEDVKKPGCL
eukprot:TRINITY_DN950_c0_g1_i2.p2 TRINITY_DN950_c0_g1~~TRINITY_DN950_c0_g1_i2.p2  ORF type:complete len:445 (+),score=111.19 TRINITY_DN950_c0_g1_i2:76-1335(+)